MNYVESFNLLGVEAKQIPCITGEGAPTTTTEGAVGCFYLDTTTNVLYKCTSTENENYTWNAFEGEKGDPGTDGTNGVIFIPHVSADGTLSWTNDGGLENPTPVNIVGNVESIGEIVQTTGNSETEVMSQKATTEAVAEVKGFFEGGNLFDPNDPDIETGGIYTSSGAWAVSVSMFETGFMKVKSTAYHHIYNVSHAVHFTYWDIDTKEYICGDNNARAEGASAIFLSPVTKISAGASYAKDYIYLRVGLSVNDENVVILDNAKGDTRYSLAPNVKVEAENLNGVVIAPVNLLDMGTMIDGYISSSGGLTPASSTTKEKTSDYIEVEAGATYTARVITHTTEEPWIAVGSYDGEKVFVKRYEPSAVVDCGDYKTRISTFTVPDGVSFVRISARKYNDAFVDLYRGSGDAPTIPYVFSDKPAPEEKEQIVGLSFGAILPPNQQANPYPVIDTANNTITFKNDTLVLDKRLGGGYVSLVTTEPTASNQVAGTCSVRMDTSAICVWLEISSKTLKATAYSAVNRIDLNNNILLVSYRRGVGAFASCPVMIDDKIYSKYDDITNKDITSASCQANKNIKSVNHRGYCTVAPENTLSAYRLSRQNGFEYVECDVNFTSDNVAVLLHDGTVDRTSNGTGNINSMTLAEVRELDFGSWKSTKYTGEKIPTFEEFIILCRALGLHPYIELKTCTAEQAQTVVSTVKRCGMKGKVSYISFEYNALSLIKDCDNTARLGYITSNVTESVITTATQLKTDNNEVFIDADYTLTNDEVLLCVNADFPLEVWTLNDESVLKTLDPYVTGVTSDNLIAGNILCDANM